MTTQHNLFDNPVLPFQLPDSTDFSCHYNEQKSGFEICIPHGRIFYAEHFFSQNISDRFVRFLTANPQYPNIAQSIPHLTDEIFRQITFENIAWKQDYISIYGKTNPLPRLTSWYGDSNKDYKYSGILSRPNPWNEGLLYIKKKIEAVAEVQFNSVLLNWYRSGNDHINWHADDETELGRNPIIASASFGASRDFVIRYNANKSLKVKIPLKHGSLLIMGGELQHYWQHCVPRRKKVSQGRFNLTFRIIHNEKDLATSTGSGQESEQKDKR